MMKIVESFVDCFNPEKTGVSFYDDILSPKYSDYMKFEKGVVGHIEKMTADEYLRRCAEEVFGCSLRDAKLGLNLKNIDKYAQMMRDGVKFNLPYLNLHPYHGPSQEGRHRMLAMAQVFGDDAEGDVLVVEPTVPVDEEIEAYAKKKFKSSGEWGIDYINSCLDKYLERNRKEEVEDPEVVESEEDIEEDEEVSTAYGISLGKGDVVDLGDGWAKINSTEVLSLGLNLYCTIINSGKEVEYSVKDFDVVKVKFD